MVYSTELKRQKHRGETKQLFLPERYWTVVVRSLHKKCGHLRVERTSELLKDIVDWPRMTAEVEQHIKTEDVSPERLSHSEPDH